MKEYFGEEEEENEYFGEDELDLAREERVLIN
jgi:hypothetical protein